MNQKNHQKTVSSDSQPNLLHNYFSQNDINKKLQNFQLDSKQKQLVSSVSPSVKAKVENFMKYTKPKTSLNTKTNYSILPAQSKGNAIQRSLKSQNHIISKHQLSQNNLTAVQRVPTDAYDTSQKFQQILASFITPKQSQVSMQFKSPLSPNIKRPDSSKNSSHMNQRTQPHSQQGSLQNIAKLIDVQSHHIHINENDLLTKNVMQKTLKINQRKNSEDIQYKFSFAENSSKSIKTQYYPNSVHQKTQSVQLFDAYKSSTTLGYEQPSLLFQKAIENNNVSSSVKSTYSPQNKMMSLSILFQNAVSKFLLDISKYNIKQVIDFVRKQVEQQDRTLMGQVIGIKTSDVLVPIDYLLSKHDLPLSILWQYSTQIQVEPMINLVPRLINHKVTFQNFDFIRCIGHGGFSQVYLVRERYTGAYYAMKLVQKNHILGQGKQSIIQCERDIMSYIEHPFLVKMHYAFESRKYFVFVLEYCSGGELFYLLKKVKRMTEKQAFFYFSEICLGMKHLHDNQIVYRDIKPENILIDYDGHVRIADFGLSKPNMEPNDVAFSFCGSPEYMAPEMLLKSGHSFKLDIYCLGALLYELITGLPPFYSRNTDEIYQRILNQKLSFPSTIKISVQLKDLLNSLLVKNPKNRISDMNGILQHPWSMMYIEMDSLESIEQKLVKPPFIPDPYNFNFDEEEFGQGEPEFLIAMRAIQQQLAENHPKQNILPNFYYSLEKHKQKDQFLKENQLILLKSMDQHSSKKFGLNSNQKIKQDQSEIHENQLSPNQPDRFLPLKFNYSPQSEHKQPLSYRLGKQTDKSHPKNERLNTLDDGLNFKVKILEAPKKSYQLRMTTDHEQKKVKH